MSDGVWNVIFDGDLGHLAPGPSRPSTNASCVHVVNERIKEKKIAMHIHLHPHIPTQSLTTMRENNG